MIFKLEESPITPEKVIVPIDGDGFAVYELLEKAGLHKNVRVACWDGYEDCIVFND
jgi:hypothetical protein